MTSTAQELLARKKNLVQLREKIAGKPRMRPTAQGRLPFSVDVCRELMEIWTDILDIDRQLLRLEVRDLNCLGERVTGRSAFVSTAVRW